MRYDYDGGMTTVKYDNGDDAYDEGQYDNENDEYGEYEYQSKDE